MKKKTQTEKQNVSTLGTSIMFVDVLKIQQKRGK